MQVLMGRLRASESERIAERLRHSMLEIILSWSMFGQKVELEFLALMVALGFVKVFHWLIQDRVNFMQTEPRVTRLQHIRTVSTLGLLMVRSRCSHSLTPCSSAACFTCYTCYETLMRDF
jgi:E3 ubiquitin-protein ligase synoviolin